MRNAGMQPLKLLNVTGSKGVSIDPDYVKEVPAGGLAVIRCKLAAPAKPAPFSGRIKIETDDPQRPVAEVTLAETVAAK